MCFTLGGALTQWRLQTVFLDNYFYNWSPEIKADYMPTLYRQCIESLPSLLTVNRLCWVCNDYVPSKTVCSWRCMHTDCVPSCFCPYFGSLSVLSRQSQRRLGTDCLQTIHRLCTDKLGSLSVKKSALCESTIIMYSSVPPQQELTGKYNLDLGRRK